MLSHGKQSNAISSLRQLCCSGLNVEMIIAEFLQIVRSVIPSENNVYTTIKPPFILDQHIFGFDGSEAIKLPVELVGNFFSPKRMQHSAAWFAKKPVLTDPTLVWDKAFYKSEPYNEVWRPLDQHKFLYVPVHQNGKPVGLLGLFRSNQHAPFTRHEQRLILKLTPYISHALCAKKCETITYGETDSNGLLIMNTQGTLLFQNQEAKRLLALVSFPVLDSKESINGKLIPGGYFFHQLQKICRNLDFITQGKFAEPPSWSFTNSRGRFIFYAHWLVNTNQNSDNLIGINIELHEPQRLIIIRALQHYELPPVQREVALLIAEGFSNIAIGNRLHIKSTTVKDHVRRIFIKLDIEHREDLLPKLLKTQKRNRIILDLN